MRTLARTCATPTSSAARRRGRSPPSMTAAALTPTPARLSARGGHAPVEQPNWRVKIQGDSLNHNAWCRDDAAPAPPPHRSWLKVTTSPHVHTTI